MGGVSKGLLASLGEFRYINLKFSSLAQAKRRALVLFLGTWSAPHRKAVPLLTRPMLQHLDLCEENVLLWDAYGLTWPEGDRTALFHIRTRYGAIAHEVIPMCGIDHWSSLSSREGRGDSHQPLPVRVQTPPLEDVKPSPRRLLSNSGSPLGKSVTGKGKLPPIASLADGCTTTASTFLSARTFTSCSGTSSPLKNHRKHFVLR